MISDKGINRLLDQLDKYIVFIQYEYNGHVIKRPYTLNRGFLKNRKPSSSNTDSRILEVWDMIDSKFVTVNGDDIVCSGVEYLDDLDESWARSNRVIGRDIEKIKELDSGNMPDFINVYCRLDVDDDEIKLANVFDLDNIDDLKNDTCDLDACKQKWINKIETQIGHALENLEEEEIVARQEHDDEGIEEIVMIRELINNVSAEAKQEMAHCTTLHEVIEYWPTLLLPKPHYAKL